MTAPGVRPDALVAVRRRFVALAFLRWFPTGLIVPVMVLLLQQRGLDLAAVGLLVALYSVTTLVLELPTGGMADVVGRRPVLVAASVLSVAASVLYATGTSLLVLGTASVLLGVARALDSGPLQAWYVDRAQELDAQADLRPALGRAGAAESLGLGGGALVGGVLVAVSPWPTAGTVVVALSTPFLVAAAVGLVHLVLVVAWVREVRPNGACRPRDLVADVPRTVVRGVVLAASRAPLRRIASFMVMLGFALAGIELLAPAAAAALLGGASSAAAPYAALVTAGFCASAAGAALAPAAARLARSSPRAVAVSAVLAAGALAAVGIPVGGAAAAAFVTFYLLLGVGGPLLDDLTHRAVSSRERATALSVNSMVLQAGGAGAALALGALVTTTSRGLAFAVAGGVLALGVLALVRWPPADRGHAETSGDEKVCQAAD
ncbi:MFS transporter [Isoptericola sp. 178]|uniref:MFS transporter n=1 Tax=Isoptericola sp. 178 TaxID=3064651 RepID=UPI0027123EF0|nr:MFS transporter [Isoptericola sp. 178]MDO8144853.1 MFS transporter [Isoptericola sp. 178]